MTDIKTLLKEARKLVDNKNFKEAQECCKNILRQDKSNYLALVLLGKSLQQSDAALLAYEKAIATKPNQPLAWQGLANYYENKEEKTSKVKLFQIYENILKLNNDEEKSLEVISKLAQLGKDFENKQTVKCFCVYINSCENSKLIETAETQLIDLLNAVSCCNEDIPLVLSSLNNIYSKNKNENIENLIGKVILQKTEFANAITEIINLNFYSTNTLLRKTVCLNLCQYFMQQNDFGNFDIENNYSNITKGIENYKYAIVLKSMIYYGKSFFAEAYKLCFTVVNHLEIEFIEALFTLKCLEKLKKWQIVEQLALNYLTILKNDKYINEIKKYIFLAYARQHKWTVAFEISKEISIDNLSLSEKTLLAQCYIELGKPINQLILNLQGTKYYDQIKALQLIKNCDYSGAISVLLKNDCTDNAVNLLYLGQAYWGKKDYDKSISSLIKSLQCDTQNEDTFLFLGHVYFAYKQDLTKARKCYEKAYLLNNTNLITVKHLSEIYVKLKQDEDDFKLLLDANTLQDDQNEPWIHFKLGLHYLKRREWDAAITEFRYVIKMNFMNATAYECLADAYFSRGSYNSALRAYKKAIDLDNAKKVHSLTRIGFIYSLLTQYDLAITTFKDVLGSNPFSLLALKGIAETFIKIAKKNASYKLYGISKDYAQTAVNYISQALSKDRQLTCLWKLLTDVLIFIVKLPQKYRYVLIGKSLVNNPEEFVEKKNTEIFSDILTCFSVIMKQKPLNAYDVACAYFDYYKSNKDLDYCSMSFKLAVDCVTHSNVNANTWNLLGKVCFAMRKYFLAQHCFIKSLLLMQQSTAKVWCNLGVLYLKLKLYKLSNYCFWRGQSASPSYPISWIGQALIAEVVRKEEAMDLFRHAAKLGYHAESALGYSDWVCRTVTDGNYLNDAESKYAIEGLYAVPYAIDLMEWCSSFEDNNPCNNTMFGILLENAGLLRPALKCYIKAFNLAPNDKKNIAGLNLARIQLRVGHLSEAIDTYKSITENSVLSACGLALAFYKKGMFEESFSMFDAAFNFMNIHPNDKVDLLVSMACAVYRLKGGDYAKLYLFQSVQLLQACTTPYGLFAICSLGILLGEHNLSKLALSELTNYRWHIEYSFDIGFLKSYALYSESNLEESIKCISDILHDHPSNPLLWFCLAQYCMKSSEINNQVASSCARKALYLSRYDTKIDSGKILATASIAEKLARNYKESLTLAKKALHEYPYSEEVLASVVYSVLSFKSPKELHPWLSCATSYILRSLNKSSPLSTWTNNVQNLVTHYKKI